MTGGVGEISRATLDGRPLDEAFNPDEQTAFAHIGGFTIEQVLEGGDLRQITQFCRVAGLEFDQDGGGPFVRKNLQAALAVADASTAGNFTRVKGYETIALAAHDAAQTPEDVRLPLDRALAIVEADVDAAPPNGSLSTVNGTTLRIITEAALSTEQNPAYIEPIFDHIRRSAMAQAGVLGDFPWRIGELMKDARRYGLGEDYEIGLLEEARATAHELPETSDRVKRLEDMAKVAFRTRHEPQYVRDILEEAQGVAEHEAEDPAEIVGYLTSLARVAYGTEQPARFIFSTLMEAHAQVRFTPDQTHEDRIRLAGSMKDIILTLADTEKPLSAQHYAAEIIPRIKEVETSPRERHMLLNAALWGIDLPEDLRAVNGITRKPLSLVFAHSG